MKLKSKNISLFNQLEKANSVCDKEKNNALEGNIEEQELGLIPLTL